MRATAFGWRGAGATAIGVIIGASVLAATSVPTVAAVGAPFPFPGSVSTSIQLLPSANGLYVVTPWLYGYAADMTAIAAIDDGRLRPGWPIALSGQCTVVPSDVDATTRAICAQRAFAFGPNGKPLKGWPVFVGGSATRVEDAVVANGNLIALTSNGSAVRLVRVSPEGRIRTGTRVTVRQLSAGCSDCSGDLGVGSDGTGYAVSYRFKPDDWGTVLSTRVTTFDLAGVRAGWPISLDGAASPPVFATDGRIYLTQGQNERAPTRLLVYDRSGRPVVGSPARLPITLPTYGGFGEGPGWTVLKPLVAADGSAAIVPAATGFGTAEGMIAVHRTDSAGRYRPAWTYRSSAAPQTIATGYCDTPSWSDPTPPAMAPDGTVYVLRADGSALGIGGDGKVRPGWPVTLRRPGAEYWSVAAGPDGRVYLLAVEPEARSSDACQPYARYSATILTVSPAGSVLHRTTIVEPTPR